MDLGSILLLYYTILYYERSFIGIDTYHVVPPLGEKKNHISTSLAPVDRVTDPPGYLNVPPENATVREAVASLVSINVNEVARLAVPLGVPSVNVQLPVNVAVNTLPFLQVIVLDVPVLPSAVTLSEKVPEKN